MLGQKNKVLLVAGIFGLVSAILIVSFLSKGSQSKEEILAVVAKGPIGSRVVIQDKMLTTRNCTRGSLPSGYIAAQDKGSVIGMASLTELKAGQPLVVSQLVKNDVRKLGLAVIIPHGRRAVSVAIDQVTGVAGFLSAEDKVDVVGTFDSDGATISKYLVQNVSLLAVGHSVDTGQLDSSAGKAENQITTATLSLLPEEVLKIASAQSRGGKICLAMRGNGDMTYVAVKEVADGKPFRQSEPIRATPTVTKTSLENTQRNTWNPPLGSDRFAISTRAKTIQIIRGSEVSTATVTN